MTSNILRIFGILVLICLVYLAISIGNKATKPAMVTARQFMTAFTNSDLDTVKSLLDTSVASVSHAGDRITGLEFKAQHISASAFSNAPEVEYSNMDITSRSIPRDGNAEMTPDNQKATVALEMTATHTPGGSIYLRQVDGKWKVFYIEEPPKETER